MDRTRTDTTRRKNSSLPVGSAEAAHERTVAAQYDGRDGSDNPIWHIYAVLAGNVSSPDDINPASFETETAQTDTWDRENQTGNASGLEIDLMTRMAYNDTGDQKLYAFYRTFKFDAMGRLATVSAETRVTVDTPEACT